MNRWIHHRSIWLACIWLACIGLAAAPCAFAGDEYEGVVGHYVLDNPSNDWHYVAINTAPDRAPFAWVNRAGERWTVGEGQEGKPGGGTEFYLTFGDGTPYPGHKLEILRDADGRVTGLKELFPDGYTQSWKRQEDKKIVGAYAGLVGDYVLENSDPSNSRHYAAINTAPDRAPFAWVNRAGERWTVGEGQEGKPGGGTEYYLTFGQDSPRPGRKLEIVRDADGQVTGLKEQLEDGHFQLWKRQ